MATPKRQNLQTVIGDPARWRTHHISIHSQTDFEADTRELADRRRVHPIGYLWRNSRSLLDAVKWWGIDGYGLPHLPQLVELRRRARDVILASLRSGIDYDAAEEAIQAFIDEVLKQEPYVRPVAYFGPEHPTHSYLLRPGDPVPTPPKLPPDNVRAMNAIVFELCFLVWPTVRAFRDPATFFGEEVVRVDSSFALSFVANSTFDGRIREREDDDNAWPNGIISAVITWGSAPLVFNESVRAVFSRCKPVEIARIISIAEAREAYAEGGRTKGAADKTPRKRRHDNVAVKRETYERATQIEEERFTSRGVVKQSIEERAVSEGVKPKAIRQRIYRAAFGASQKTKR